jgi:hypothetical protein
MRKFLVVPARQKPGISSRMKTPSTLTPMTSAWSSFGRSRLLPSRSHMPPYQKPPQSVRTIGAALKPFLTEYYGQKRHFFA